MDILKKIDESLNEGKVVYKVEMEIEISDISPIASWRLGKNKIKFPKGWKLIRITKEPE